MTTAGDLPYASAANALARLAIGVADRFLGVAAGLPSWKTLQSASASDGIGYATGAGGTVTQLTSKGTAVTLNKICGRITTHGQSLAGGAETAFLVNNTSVALGDVVVVNGTGPGGAGSSDYMLGVGELSTGQFTIIIANVTAGALAEVLTINFAIIKAVTA